MPKIEECNGHGRSTLSMIMNGSDVEWCYDETYNVRFLSYMTIGKARENFSTVYLNIEKDTYRQESTS